MKLPSIPLETVMLPTTTVLVSKISRSNHKRYYILRFKEEDVPNMMDLLHQMENLRWEKTLNSNGCHLSLYLADEKKKISDEVLKSLEGKELKFEVRGLGFRVRLGQLKIV